MEKIATGACTFARLREEGFTYNDCKLNKKEKTKMTKTTKVLRERGKTLSFFLAGAIVFCAMPILAATYYKAGSDVGRLAPLTFAA